MREWPTFSNMQPGSVMELAQTHSGVLQVYGAPSLNKLGLDAPQPLISCEEKTYWTLL